MEAEATLPVTLAREMVIDGNGDSVLGREEEAFDGKCEKRTEQDADARSHHRGTSDSLGEYHIVVVLIDAMSSGGHTISKLAGMHQP